MNVGELEKILSKVKDKKMDVFMAERKNFTDFKYSQKDCLHKNVVEELSGGRRDRCNDCGKTWG